MSPSWKSSVWATLVLPCVSSAITLPGKSSRKETANDVGIPACNTSGLVTTNNVLQMEEGTRMKRGGSVGKKNTINTERSHQGVLTITGITWNFTWMNPELKQAQQTTPFPNTQVGSRSHPCFCPLLRRTVIQTLNWQWLLRNAQVTWCRHYTTPPSIFIAKSHGAILTVSPHNYTHPIHLLLYIFDKHKREEWNGEYSHTLNALAQGDVSRLSILDLTIARALQTAVLMLRHQQKEKMHLKCQKEHKSACNFWH